MKKTVFPHLFAAAFAVGFILLSSGCCTKNECGTKQTAQPQAPCLQKNFFLPEHIYAVPGLECNIYFRNIFLAVNHANYSFDVICKSGRYGRHDLKRWRFTPKAEDGGKDILLTIEVSDGRKVVASGSTTVHVAPSDAGKGREVVMLIVGDSLTNATVYPTRIHTLCKGANNPKLVMLGTHRGSGRPPLPGGVAHEGYGGWKWDSFLTRWREIDPAAKSTPIQRFYAKSKFLMLKDGKPVFSLANYLKKNNFKMPDVVTFQLGVNDVFGATDANRDQMIEKILDNAEKLIANFRREAPNALIGVGFVTPGANQDAFGNNYKCGQTSWGYYVNQFRLNQAMARRFAGRDKLVMIPGNINLDSENNFPAVKEAANAENPTEVFRQSNGVHPAASGYNQMGDAYFAWLKNMLAAKQEKNAK